MNLPENISLIKWIIDMHRLHISHFVMKIINDNKDILQDMLKQLDSSEELKKKKQLGIFFKK